MPVILPLSSWTLLNFKLRLLRKPFLFLQKATLKLVFRFDIAKFSKLKLN
jgi:hypothetical protein